MMIILFEGDISSYIYLHWRTKTQAVFNKRIEDLEAIPKDLWYWSNVEPLVVTAFSIMSKFDKKILMIREEGRGLRRNVSMAAITEVSIQTRNCHWGSSHPSLWVREWFHVIIVLLECGDYWLNSARAWSWILEGSQTGSYWPMPPCRVPLPDFVLQYQIFVLFCNTK